MVKVNVQERDRALNEALEFIKNCPYKGTAIKVELEAELNREGQSNECRDCNGNGENYCQVCDDGLTAEGETCGSCEGEYLLRCDTCSGTGENPGRSASYESERECKEFILRHVSQEARDSLIFSKFYDDGSVDSEYTFTLPLDKASLTIEFIEAFNALAQEIGNGIDTNGAGMHIAILNSRDGNYPLGNKLNATYTKNFRNAMNHLMPALYFLGSADHESRDTGYRVPQVSDDKYSAVNFGCDVFEYRVFETCYKRPEAIIDFICVIAKSLQFYQRKATTLDFFGKVGSIGFGTKGRGIERFYYSQKHLDALQYGVAVLKPSYKTFADLKKERNFKLTPKRIKDIDTKRTLRWRQEFSAVKERNKENLERLKAEAALHWEAETTYSSNNRMAEQYGSRENFIERYVMSRRANYPTRVDTYIRSKLQALDNTGTQLTI